MCGGGWAGLGWAVPSAAVARPHELTGRHNRTQGTAELVQRDRFGIPEDEGLGGASHHSTIASLMGSRRTSEKLVAAPAPAEPSEDAAVAKMV